MERKLLTETVDKTTVVVKKYQLLTEDRITLRLWPPAPLWHLPAAARPLWHLPAAARPPLAPAGGRPTTGLLGAITCLLAHSTNNRRDIGFVVAWPREERELDSGASQHRPWRPGWPLLWVGGWDKWRRFELQRPAIQRRVLSRGRSWLG